MMEIPNSTQISSFQHLPQITSFLHLASTLACWNMNFLNGGLNFVTIAASVMFRGIMVSRNEID